MAKKKQSYWRFLLEAFLIVFSVVLALTLNEWRGSVKEQRQFSAIRQRIQTELIQSKAQVCRMVIEHGALVSHLDSLRKNPRLLRRVVTSDGLDFDVLAPMGLATNMVYTGSAWQIACNSGLASNFSFEEQDCLPRFYEQQDIINSYVEKLISFLISLDRHALEDPGNVVYLTRQMTWQLKGMEQRLKSLAEKAIATMEKTDSLADNN